MMIKLKGSEIETTYVDHRQILFLQSSVLGVRVGIDIHSTVPYIIEVLGPIEEILAAIQHAQDNEYTQLLPFETEGTIECSG